MRIPDLVVRAVLGLVIGGGILVVVGLQRAASPDAAEAQATNWTSLAPGLELARFATGKSPVSGDGLITVLRMDPERWELTLLCSSELGALTNRSVGQWSRDFGLVAAINAGMYATDHRRHVGYMRNGSHVNSKAVNKYQSVAAFAPRRAGLPPFRIFDLDETDLAEIEQDYGAVIQNLRMIKRPGQNRWEPQDRQWSEAALGEDRQGRPLFIFTRSAYSVHDLNEILLALPLDLVCAQHLEGGPEAQFSIHYGEIEVDQVGSFETNFLESDANTVAWPVPNVLGVVPRGSSAGKAPAASSD